MEIRSSFFNDDIIVCILEISLVYCNGKACARWDGQNQRIRRCDTVRIFNGHLKIDINVTYCELQDDILECSFDKYQNIRQIWLALCALPEKPEKNRQ